MPLSDEQERFEAIGEQLRAKIASKFAASTFLAGFAATILTGLLAVLWEGPNTVPSLFPPAFGCAMAGTVLFILGIIRLDELSMPKRFWPSSRKAPAAGGDVSLLRMEDLWGLHDRMVYFWGRLTLLGTGVTGVAFMLLLLPQSYVVAESLRVATFCWAVAGAVVAYGYGRVLDLRAPHRDTLVRPVD